MAILWDVVRLGATSDTGEETNNKMQKRNNESSARLKFDIWFWSLIYNTLVTQITDAIDPYYITLIITGTNGISSVLNNF